MYDDSKIMNRLIFDFLDSRIYSQMASDDDVHSLYFKNRTQKPETTFWECIPICRLRLAACAPARARSAPIHTLERTLAPLAPDPDPPLFYEHKSLGVPEVRETATNNMSVPHSAIHSSNFTNPDETEDGERKKDSGDAPKPKVSEGKVGHKRKGLMK